MNTLFASRLRLALPVLVVTLGAQASERDAGAEALANSRRDESSVFSRSLVSLGDPARLQQALARARRGGAVTVGVISSSMIAAPLA